MFFCGNIYVPFSLFYPKENCSLNYLGARLGLLAVVVFLFRCRLFGAWRFQLRYFSISRPLGFLQFDKN
ncbi:MAG: hypothetical protein BA871_13610 [Desulfuromonadales bacterium C00003096]|nr:MAG: hypothetical protein BA871_13610 [Desulfuromonadales bacterium C00003096]